MQEVLSGKKTSNLWYSAKSKENPKPSITSDSELCSRNKTAEAELNKLQIKWKNYPVADYIKNLLDEAIDPVENSIQRLFDICLGVRIYPSYKIEEGKKVSFALANLGVGSFIVGLEYPDFNLNDPNLIKDMPYQLLDVASELAATIPSLYLTQLFQKSVLSKPKVLEKMDEIEKIILNVRTKCFDIGARCLHKRKHHLY